MCVIRRRMIELDMALVFRFMTIVVDVLCCATRFGYVVGAIHARACMWSFQDVT